MVALQENMVVADRFRLVRMVGRGGMGSVWQAIQVGLDRPCAVKFIEGELASVAEAHARFEREAKAAAQLNSPNVVQIYEHGVWQGHPYIAMELLEGEDLGKRLTSSGGRLPARDVTFVVQQVCRALSRAHHAGVVHRDLKPDNIFVVKDDDRDIVKILDFGVAKSASQTLDGSNTKTGAMLGTPYYMSPEQAQGIKSVDSRSDLWSLAVIVFQCLTGRLPFESEALGDLLVKIIVSPIPTPSHVFPMVPPGFDAWWVRASDRNPDNRYQTAKEFAEELSRSLGQASVSDFSERSRLHRGSERPGASTALMVGGPAPNTPHPGAHTAAMETPNPMFTPPGMQAGPPHGGHPGMGSQPGYGHPSAGQMGASPGGHPGMVPGPHATTGNPVAATYSGLDAQGVPKKGAPVALFVGIGLLALVGLGLGGVALVKGRTVATGGGEPEGSASAVASAPVSAAATAEQPVASATEAASAPPAPAEPSASAAAEPTATVAAAPTHASTGGVHRPAPPATKTAAPVASAKPTATAATAATPATTKAGGKEKPINLGF
jgi:serine/threonine protein kinase